MISRNTFRPVFLFAIFTGALLNAEPERESEPNPVDDSIWELTFEDTFDGPKLDYSKWTPLDPWGVERNDELQAYGIKAFHQDGGILKIRATRQPAFYDGKKRDYRSGMMSTTKKFSQTYGRFEIRCRVPAGRGLWPAFWMLPEPPAWPPEIDVLEIIGHDPDKVYMSNHWVNPSNPTGDSKSITGEFRGPDFSKQFHLFCVEWEPDEIRWYVDGIQRHSSRTEVPAAPMFMLVNLAIGGGWAGDPDEKTVFPADFEIDHVRVWKRKP